MTAIGYASNEIPVNAQVKRGPINQKIGIEVDTLDLTILYQQGELYSLYSVIDPDFNPNPLQKPMANWLMDGAFDGAKVTVRRVFCSAPGVIVGSIELYAGTVAEVANITGSEAQMQVVSDLELLNIELPRNVYQAQCVWSIYDDGCGLGPTSRSATGVVLAGSNQTHIVHNLTANAGYFNQGMFGFRSGANTSKSLGEYRTIKEHTANMLVFTHPLSEAPVPGVSFRARAGCNRSLENCTLLANTDNIRFYKTIPTPETSY